MTAIDTRVYIAIQKHTSTDAHRVSSKLEWHVGQ